MIKQGKFIVLEGLEGAGKTTAQKTILEVLKQNNLTDIVYTREPGGTAVAEQLRSIIKYSIENEVITDKAELLMLYAARIQLVENVIKPALHKGKWVIGDRHDMSSQAYQGGGRQMDNKLLTTLKELILEDFKPDLTIYLDIEPSLGIERAQGRGGLDRIEEQDIAFFNRTRNKYLELIHKDKNINNYIIIDANNELAQVTSDIRENLQNWLNINK